MLKWILALAFLASPVWACQYSAKMRAFDRAVANWVADPTSVNADKVCNIWRQIGYKFGGDPDKPQPALPAGIACGGSGTGGGRSGFMGGVPLPGAPFGPGGVIGHIGDSHGLFFWIRNHQDVECSFSYTIIPDPGNPPGMTVTPLNGVELVPPRGSLPVPFDVFLDPLLADGALATFRIEVIDLCSGLPLPDDTSVFEVWASADCSVLPNDPFLLAAPGSSLTASWTLTNYRADVSLVKPFSFVALGDPNSLVALNNGSPFFVPNIFPADKSVTGGSVTVPPLDSVVITWDDLRPGEFCDPQMIGCCGLLMDGIPVPVPANLFNDMGILPGGDPITPNAIAIELHQLSLVGLEPLGPQVEIQVPPFQFIEPTLDFTMNPRPIPDVIDGLAQQILYQSQLTNGFDVSVMVMDDALTVFTQPLIPVDFLSLDPLLQWQPQQMPYQPLLPQWPQLDLMLQAVETVNGWRRP